MQSPLSRRPAAGLLTAILVYTALGLAGDRATDATGQLLLGLLTFAALALSLAFVAPRARVQVVLLVAIATVGELLASLVWGLYTYRLDNVPLFVPPGHGLVYVAGLALAMLVSGRERLLRGAAVGALAVWAALGLTILPRPDLGGAIGCALLAVVLLRTHVTLYAAMFIVVAALELYGTAIGAWTWAETIPGTQISNGNPPSGVASGYVLLDVLTLTAAARLSGTLARARQYADSSQLWSFSRRSCRNRPASAPSTSR